MCLPYMVIIVYNAYYVGGGLVTGYEELFVNLSPRLSRFREKISKRCLLILYNVI